MRSPAPLQRPIVVMVLSIKKNALEMVRLNYGSFLGQLIVILGEVKIHVHLGSGIQEAPQCYTGM